MDPLLPFDLRTDQRTAAATIRSEHELDGVPCRLTILSDAERELGDDEVVDAVRRGLSVGYRWAHMTAESETELRGELASPWIDVLRFEHYRLPPGSQLFFDAGYRRGWEIQRQQAAGYAAGTSAAESYYLAARFDDVGKMQPPPDADSEFQRGWLAGVDAHIKGRR